MLKFFRYKSSGDDGEAYTNSVVSAIDYATDMHVNVINLSLGSDQFDQTLLSAIQRAISNNITVVGASGNCAMNNQTFVMHFCTRKDDLSALYPEVIAVGSSTNTRSTTDYSGYGPQLDVIALVVLRTFACIQQWIHKFLRFR